jgi:hypothetical protein
MVLAPFTSHAHLTDFPPPHGGPARITTVLDLSLGHLLAFRFLAAAGRTLPAAALAEVLDGSAERARGYAPLWAGRRRAREQGLDGVLAGCDPAERSPALQALLPTCCRPRPSSLRGIVPNTGSKVAHCSSVRSIAASSWMQPTTYL